MSETILIVEDNKNISKLIKYNLEKAGYDCRVVSSGGEVLGTLRKGSFDLVILDIMLPELDGFEVCRLIKQEDKLKTIPIIMLTAKGEEVDRVVGLELGADDYMVKPFSPRELVLRVKAILRRGKVEARPKDVLKAGGIIVDKPGHKVTVDSKEVELTAMEFKLLVTLIERRGRVQSRDILLNDVWGMNADVYTRTVDTHIRRLRKKLGKPGRSIETVVGIGYRFKQDEDED